MSGLPIKSFDEVLRYLSFLESLSRNISSSLQPLNNIEYKYTWDNYKYTLDDSIPAKIIDLSPENIDYQIFIENASIETIFLYLGPDGNNNLSIDNSAWKILPTETAEIKSKACIIWALASNTCDIIISIHSNKENLFKGEEEMPSPLILEKIGPTGDKFVLPINFHNNDGRDYLETKFDSHLGFNGFKFFTFSSFDSIIAQGGYEFGLEFDPVIDAIIDYRNDADFVQIHRLSYPLLDRFKMLYAAGWLYDGLPKNPWEGVNTWISGGRILNGERKFKNLPIFKDNENNIILDDKIRLHPSLLSNYYLFKIRIDIGEYRIAVFDYNINERSFIIKGF